jgi:hypothetical protein
MGAFPSLRSAPGPDSSRFLLGLGALCTQDPKQERQLLSDAFLLVVFVMLAVGFQPL